jgi:hypothetical protein
MRGRTTNPETKVTTATEPLAASIPIGPPGCR